MASQIPVSGMNPMDVDRHTPRRTVGNTSALKERFRSLFGDMPMIREMDAYDSVSDVHNTLPYYKVNRAVYLEEKFKGLISRSGGWMERILPWSETNEIHFQWNEYVFNHTLVGRVPHMGNPRMTSYRRVPHNDNAVRRGIGFMMEAGELLTEEGTRQYQMNIEGITACIIETVYLSSIYALLDAGISMQRDAENMGVSPVSIHEAFKNEINDFAAVAASQHGFVEVVHRKKNLLEDSVVALITSPESGLYLSEVTAKYTDTEPSYYTQGPNAIMSKPVSMQDYVIPLSGNGALNVFTARDMKFADTGGAGKQGNFVRPLLSRPYIGEYNVHRGKPFITKKFFNGFNDLKCNPCYSTDMRTIEVYSTRQDAMVELPYERALQHTLFANKGHLAAIIEKSNGSDHPFTASDFLPFDLSKKMTSFDKIPRHADAFPEIDMATFKRGAPPTICWDPSTHGGKGGPKVTEFFGEWDPTAMGPRLLENVAATISAGGEWTEFSLPIWRDMTDLLIAADNEPYNAAFMKNVLDYNMDANVTSGGDIAYLPAKIGDVEGAQLAGLNTGSTGILRLPPRRVGGGGEPVDPLYPPGFGGYALLKAAAMEYNQGTGWDHIAKPAHRALQVLEHIRQLINDTQYNIDISAKHKPVNVQAVGRDAELAALVQNLVYVDRKPVFVQTPKLGAGETFESGTYGTFGSSEAVPFAEEGLPTLYPTVAGEKEDEGGEGEEAPEVSEEGDIHEKRSTFDLSPLIQNAQTKSQQVRVQTFRVGSAMPIVGVASNTQVPLVCTAGEEAKAVSSLETLAAKRGFVTTVSMIRSARDALVKEGVLSPEEVIVDPVLSEYASSAANAGSSDKKEQIYAGTAAIIRQKFADAATRKEGFLSSVELIKGLNDRFTQRNRSAKITPGSSAIIKKGKELISEHSKGESAGKSFALYPLTSTHSSFKTAVNSASRNADAADSANVLDNVANAVQSAIWYSMAKYAHGADANALLMFNPKEGIYNKSITLENIDKLAICDTEMPLAGYNATAAVYNYAGDDRVLIEAQQQVVTGLGQLKKSTPVLSKGSATSKRDMKDVSPIGYKYGASDEEEYVLTSMYWTKGMIDSKDSIEGKLVYLKRSIDGENFAYIGNNTLMHTRTSNVVFSKTYSGTIAAGARLAPQSGWISATGKYSSASSGSGLGKKKTDFFASMGASYGMSTKSSSRYATSRDFGSSYASGESFIGADGGSDDPYAIRPPGEDTSAFKHSLFATTTMGRGGEFKHRAFDEDDPRSKYRKGEMYSSGDYAFTKSRNYIHHMVSANEIKNPIVRLFAHAFLNSRCLVEPGQNPYRKMCNKDVLVPVAIINIRPAIEHAMETWIMTEMGYKVGANALGNNQFYVSIDGVSMIIYGALAFYHKSLIYNKESIALLPNVRPRQYIAGSETTYFTSERQLELHAPHRPDVIALAVSMEEERWGGALPLTGYFDYPDMNKQLEAGQFMPSYSGWREFRQRFPIQVRKLENDVYRERNRTYRDMHKRLAPVMFQGKQIEWNFNDGGPQGRRNLLIRGQGHRKEKTGPGNRVVWDGRGHHFFDPHLRSMEIAVP